MRKVNCHIAAAFLFLVSGWTFAQQVADTLYNPEILNPVYGKGQGPIVLIDEAHFNFHTLKGKFSAFAHVLEKDGYQVHASTEPFTQEQLDKGEILVIANALHPSNLKQWTSPNPSAFTDAEVKAVNDWVRGGGCLFLIADHMPFPGAAEELAASFGIKFYNGFAMRKRRGKDIFTYGNGLVENVLTEGRNENEKVTSLQSFTGQAFEIPENASPVLVLDSNYDLKMPETAWQFDSKSTTVSAENLIQGAYMHYGKGRIVVFGEAAMFTAQLQGKNKMGMNQKTASRNFQLLLNIMHWFDGMLD